MRKASTESCARSGRVGQSHQERSSYLDLSLRQHDHGNFHTWPRHNSMNG